MSTDYPKASSRLVIAKPCIVEVHDKTICKLAPTGRRQKPTLLNISRVPTLMAHYRGLIDLKALRLNSFVYLLDVKINEHCILRINKLVECGRCLEQINFRFSVRGVNIAPLGETRVGG